MLSEIEKTKKKLTETLIKGRNSTKGLQNLLRRKVKFDGSVSIEDLLSEIMGSFSGGLSILNSCNSGEICGGSASTHVGLTSTVDQMPEVYSGKKPAPVVKERRGCYKRRRAIDSKVKISGTTADAYAWRKYGEKEIVNSKFPRCYYRCTDKHVHGCEALKQVQKSDDESNMFHITYIGHHTCPTPNTISQHGIVLDFEDSKNHHHFLYNPSPIPNIHIDPSVKQEVESKTQSADVSDNISSANNNHSSQALVWNEVLMDDLGPCHDGASFMGFDYDSCASTSSHDYLDMDFFKSGDSLSDILLVEDFS